MYLPKFALDPKIEKCLMNVALCQSLVEIPHTVNLLSDATSQKNAMFYGFEEVRMQNKTDITIATDSTKGMIEFLSKVFGFVNI